MNLNFVKIYIKAMFIMHLLKSVLTVMCFLVFCFKLWSVTTVIQSPMWMIVMLPWSVRTEKRFCDGFVVLSLCIEYFIFDMRIALNLIWNLFYNFAVHSDRNFGGRFFQKLPIRMCNKWGKNAYLFFKLNELCLPGRFKGKQNHH